MKKLKFALIIGMSFLSLVFSSLLYADSRANTLVFNFGSGEEYFASKRLLKNTNVNYLGFGYNFTRHWGIEGLLGFFNTRFKPQANYDESVSGNLYLLDGIYHFDAYKHFLEPFILAGVGITGISPNRTDANNEGNINGAVGVNLFFDKSVALRLEVRDLYTIIGGKNDIFLNAAISFFWNLG